VALAAHEGPRMTRRKVASHTPADRLARLLMEAYVSAWAKGNPGHDAPAWEDVRLVSRMGFRQVAEELFRLGVRPPLEDLPDRVEWVDYEDYAI
jgi:hypothetical protein